MASDIRPQSSVSLQSKQSVICPDPSVHAAHEKHAKLQEAASTAALYVTKDKKDTTSEGDAKLSSASAAASLKYAKPQDLPAFPIVGIDTSTSASKAALLAHNNPKDIKWWTPEKSDSAGKAALLAHDYKMSPSWQPEASAAGSKAALLAHRNSMAKAEAAAAPSATGNSAAGAALRKEAVALRKETVSPAKDTGDAEMRRKALLAATGAYQGSQRKRSGSTPTPIASYPDAANSAYNALNAATIVHRNSVRSPKSPPPTMGPSSAALEASRVQNIGKNVPREMFGDAPPVAIEIEEKRHNDALRASAISMAQKMYAVQQTKSEEATRREAALAGATKVHGRSQSTSAQDIRTQALQFVKVQDAAQRLAAERLSKIQGDESHAFRDYYGYGKQPRKRLSMRSGRRRASSEGRAEDLDSDDEEQSRRIRSQMSLFTNQVAQVDSRKRQKDREALLAAAEKKVHAQMHSMDEKVFNDTGKMSHSMIEEWDAKARARAAAESEARMQNHGKVHVGGGKFMDQSEINAIASARLQPTLDEINENAELHRARDEELRLDMEEKKRELQVERQREAELKQEEKRIKDYEKHAAKQKKADEKDAAKAEKNAEKARKAEEKRAQKEEKRISKDIGKTGKPSSIPSEQDHDEEPITGATVDGPADVPAIVATNTGASIAEDAVTSSPPPTASAAATSTTPVRDSVATESSALQHIDPRPDDANTPGSPSKQDKGIRGLINKLKRRSKHTSMSDSNPSSPTKSSFVGGAALTGAKPSEGSSAKPTIQAEDAPAAAVGGSLARAPSPSISSLSSSGDEASASAPAKPNTSLLNKLKKKQPRGSVSDEEEFEEARDRVDADLAPPPKFKDENIGTGAIRKSASPVRETIFREEF